MFIATKGLAQTLAPLGAKPGQTDCPSNRKDNCAPTELSSKKESSGYEHLARLGRSDKQCSTRPG